MRTILFSATVTVFLYRTMNSTKARTMATKHEKIREILDRTPESDIHIYSFPDGMTRVDFAFHLREAPGSEKWKEVRSKAKGIWADRPEIIEEMAAIRKGCNRSFDRNE